jgi:hypothetical protein
MNWRSRVQPSTQDSIDVNIQIETGHEMNATQLRDVVEVRREVTADLDKQPTDRMSPRPPPEMKPRRGRPRYPKAKRIH